MRNKSHSFFQFLTFQNGRDPSKTTSLVSKFLKSGSAFFERMMRSAGCFLISALLVNGLSNKIILFDCQLMQLSVIEILLKESAAEILWRIREGFKLKFLGKSSSSNSESPIKKNFLHSMISIALCFDTLYTISRC